jgi:hypothetical protein
MILPSWWQRSWNRSWQFLSILVMCNCGWWDGEEEDVSSMYLLEFRGPPQILTMVVGPCPKYSQIWELQGHEPTENIILLSQWQRPWGGAWQFLSILVACNCGWCDGEEEDVSSIVGIQGTPPNSDFLLSIQGHAYQMNHFCQQREEFTGIILFAIPWLTTSSPTINWWDYLLHFKLKAIIVYCPNEQVAVFYTSAPLNKCENYDSPTVILGNLQQPHFRQPTTAPCGFLSVHLRQTTTAQLGCFLYLHPIQHLWQL